MQVMKARSATNTKRRTLPPLNLSAPRLFTFVSDLIATPIMSRSRSKSRSLDLSDDEECNFSEQGILLLKNFIVQ
ncbi:hypothetical protein SS50377_27143 [Spironucleus salmonicida]|uniref:Uncharacterized protein n=1 Tax=Spironucleus salmonicida TaxID=348837 RepID=V6LXA3_9EUKA|nr:hypothetical protein SS50377_27142 [Spironucleus salmonicida]KAH0570850.1 hypothetical protein SS50377_27143 [Spironucleus salmonicida]|eukprot:EST43730.1 Hypothetical protein SS50377_16460 [Spironucleus salmonicida]